ncbi:MAG: hypothetical protein AABW68_03680 [archaeon]
MVGKASDIPFTGGNQRVRDHILVLLSEEFPLTPKSLYTRISKNGNEVSYQAVHKAIQQLIGEGILEKKSIGVQLSQNWIHRVRDYAFTVDTIYTKGKIYKLPTNFDKPYSLSFNDFSTYVVWMAETLRDGKFSNGKTGPIFGLFYHAPWPLRFNFIDFELLRQMASNCQTYGVCVCDMPFDRWIANHYRLAGIKAFKTGIKLKLEDDFFVVDDVIVRVKFSTETRKFMDKIYSKITDLKQLFHYYFTEVDKKDPSSIEVIIERNPTMARMIQNQIMQYLDDGTKK